jgi:organic hydroperoxide reductase OsmC/OhrA
MPEKDHHYTVKVTWTGNLECDRLRSRTCANRKRESPSQKRGPGTTSYAAFSRAHTIESNGKPPIQGSSDPAFRGDPTSWNPEQLLLAALSTCHQLWYLHLCAEAGIIVTAYQDHAEATMHEETSGAGQFTTVTLRPRVTITATSDAAKAQALHHHAHEMCFIARSVNFPVHTEATIEMQ